MNRGDFVRDKVLSYGLVNVVSQATQNTNNYRELIGKTADLFRELKPFYRKILTGSGFFYHSLKCREHLTFSKNRSSVNSQGV